jgi:hypothetical protein
MIDTHADCLLPDRLLDANALCAEFNVQVAIAWQATPLRLRYVWH